MGPGAAAGWALWGYGGLQGFLKDSVRDHMSSELQTHTQDVLWTILPQCILPHLVPCVLKPRSRGHVPSPSTWAALPSCGPDIHLTTVFIPQICFWFIKETNVTHGVVSFCLAELPCEGLIPSACVLSHLSCVRLCVTPWTVTHQGPLSMGFSRQEYWSE